MAKSSVCLSVVRPSVTLRYRHHMLEFFENNFTISLLYGPLVHARPQHYKSTPKGTPWNCDPKWPTPYRCWIERRRHSMVNNVSEWLEIPQWSQWGAYRKPPSLFPLVRSVTPYYLSYTQNGRPRCTLRHLLNMVSHSHLLPKHRKGYSNV